MQPPTPRHELAAAAYAHALTVLGSTSAATEAAIVAVRSGGRSLATVLGHARDAALGLEVQPPPPDDLAVPDDLDELALSLSLTRPAAERAVVDLDTRYGLDQAALGQALGMAPVAAAELAADVAAEWQRSLDPALLAHLGPGSCAELAELLRAAPDDPPSRGEPTDGQATRRLADVLADGERAAAHTEGCESCRDRLRAMVSVRTLLGQRPIGEPPDTVLASAAVAKLRPSGMPPPLGGTRMPANRRLPAVAALVATVLAAAAVGVVLLGNDDGSDDELAALTQLPAASADGLTVQPRTSTRRTTTVVLRNLAAAPTTWRATPDKPWLQVDPPSGELTGGATRNVVVSVGPEAPEGDVVAAVTFTGSDGSTAVASVRTAVSRPPDVAVEITGCRVVAVVEDDTEITSVSLRDAAGSEIPMTPSDTDGTWESDLAGRAGDWSVVAVDAFGHRTSVPARPEGSC
ncbi:MAG TPA: hypothetical protein VFV35_07140 [Acidimicrobiales bacterium]|nr:hypothetical protein [Acidimicrobiales bacterium]